ncbi:hypothetical protein C9374_002460 [Naegleria lovaniensis]|uniref:Uncharacterized protein n=1 Tax=Naegleria lovaniensis TaxID=51637 RepID=A0AA88GQU7_NAELO|nr:uncharacterized protein C9374_002460 [Naegleria lovaniensis]KAG2386716.1 hypothetical protein C9374_002460 [Naegleria lovaniensis]
MNKPRRAKKEALSSHNYDKNHNHERMENVHSERSDISTNSKESSSSLPRSSTSSKFSSILIAVLPTLLTSVMDLYIDMHLTKYYLEDICSDNSNHDQPYSLQCISPSRFGLIHSLIRSLSLFTDFFSATIIDSHLPFQQPTLLIVLAPLYWFSICALFMGPSMIHKYSNHENMTRWLFSTDVWYTLCSLMKNMIPLRVLYDSSMMRMCKTWNVKDRADLFSFKHQASLYGGLLGGFLPPLVTWLMGDGPVFPQFYVLFGSCMVILSYVVMGMFLRRKQTMMMESGHENSPEKKKNPSWIPSLRKCFENRAFLVLLYLFTYETLRGLLWNGLYILYLTKVLHLEGSEFDFYSGVMHTAGMVGAMVFTPVWQLIASKYGNYNSWLFSYMLQIPIGVFVYLVIDYSETTSQIYWYLPFFMLLTITGRASGFLLDGIKSTVFDYDELRTGERREASIEATWSVIPRYVDMLSSSVSFGILSYFNTYGMTPGQIAALKNGEYTINGKRSISVQAALLPSLTSIICLLLMYKFPINDEMHSKILEELKKKRESNINSQPSEIILDPITNEKIRNDREAHHLDASAKRELSLAKDYFFSFELENMKRSSFYLRHAWHIEIALCTLLFACCLTFGYHFVTSVLLGRDMFATLFLWLSSVTFTWSGFHFSRIGIARKIVK